ncbi:MAG: hypothetical protein JWQ54_2017 [Mucilaginibacter sp.]|nr:hypothetical protein [Mucilaginibacter sp.]
MLIISAPHNAKFVPWYGHILWGAEIGMTVVFLQYNIYNSAFNNNYLFWGFVIKVFLYIGTG